MSEDFKNEQAFFQKKYPALRIIANIYKGLAWLVAITSFIMAWVLVGYIYFFILTIVVGAIVAVSLLALSEGIKVFIDIEKNTRR